MPRAKAGRWQELKDEIKSLKAKNLYRSLEEVSSESGAEILLGRRRLVNFASNNYLGLAQHPRVKSRAAAAVSRWGTGSGASRLISGNLAVHTELEKKLARFKKESAALVFSSGYLANLAAVTALVDARDLVLVDRLNHASLIDAARLSKAKLWVYPHKDLATLEALLKRGAKFRRRLVVTDAYFSMDGDVAPLPGLVELCVKNGALLMIDEAHSTGVFGASGAGLTERFKLQGKIDVVMGTLSKALGSVGGFLAGDAVLMEHLINRGREFIYTTAPAPSASAAALASLEVIQGDGALRAGYWRRIAGVRRGLEALGFDLMDSEGPIIPLLIKDTRKTLAVKEFLRKQGLFVSAVRPPTVSPQTDRIRLSLTAAHTQDHLALLLSALKKAKDKGL